MAMPVRLTQMFARRRTTGGRRTLTAVLVLATVLTPTLGSASAAYAATCRTRGTAYIIAGGNYYLSGIEGDQRFGIPTWTTSRLDSFFLGGNGIKPRTRMLWEAFRVPNGGVFPIQPAETSAAMGNCVVNQEPNERLVTAPPGSYEIFASYDVLDPDGSTRRIRSEHVANATVVS